MAIGEKFSQIVIPASFFFWFLGKLQTWVKQFNKEKVAAFSLREVSTFCIWVKLIIWDSQKENENLKAFSLLLKDRIYIVH